jgi:hypothetical protein
MLTYLAPTRCYSDYRSKGQGCVGGIKRAYKSPLTCFIEECSRTIIFPQRQKLVTVRSADGGHSASVR